MNFVFVLVKSPVPVGGWEILGQLTIRIPNENIDPVPPAVSGGFELPVGHIVRVRRRVGLEQQFELGVAAQKIRIGLSDVPVVAVVDHNDGIVGQVGEGEQQTDQLTAVVVGAVHKIDSDLLIADVIF